MQIVCYRASLETKNRTPFLEREREVEYSTNYLNSSESIVKLMNSVFSLGNLAEEYVYMIALNTQNTILGVFEVSHGTVNKSYCDTREIFIRAILCGATSIVLVHNHPALGALTPSKEDITVTKQIKKAGNLLNIRLLEHVIICGSDYVSLKNQGYC